MTGFEFDNELLPPLPGVDLVSVQVRPFSRPDELLVCDPVRPRAWVCSPDTVEVRP